VSDNNPDNHPDRATGAGAEAHHEKLSEYDSTIDYDSAVDDDSAAEYDAAVGRDAAADRDAADRDAADRDAADRDVAPESDSTAHFDNVSDREAKAEASENSTTELAAEADGVIAEAVAADIEATGPETDHSSRSKYVPPALVDPDAAARAVSAAAAARSAERAVERANAAAKLAGLSSGSAAVDEAIGYTPPARLTNPVPVVENQAPAARSADLVQFTAPNKVIGRSNYVITPESDSDVAESATAVPARPTATEPVQATTDPADAVFTRPEQRIVYVEAPAAPQKKGNRGIGSLLAVVSAIAFAVLFAAVIFLLFWLTTGRAVTNFIGEESFFVPVVMYAIGFVLLVLVLNRAAWWSYILGSIFVGLFVYFGTAGVLLLLGGVIEATPAQAGADFARALANPLVIAAGIIARETSLWTGAAIASRGRRVKAKNAKAMDQYNQEMEDRKAGNGRASAGPAA
jgi:hypothetical protein